MTKKIEEKAYNKHMDFTIDKSFNLIKEVADHKNVDKSKMGSVVFLLEIISIVINRLLYEGYCSHIIKDMLSDCLKHELKIKAERAKEDVKNFKSIN